MVLHFPKSSNITGASPDGLVSDVGHLVVESYSTVEIQLGVVYSPRQLGKNLFE